MQYILLYRQSCLLWHKCVYCLHMYRHERMPKDYLAAAGIVVWWEAEQGCWAAGTVRAVWAMALLLWFCDGSDGISSLDDWLT